MNRMARAEPRITNQQDFNRLSNMIRPDGINTRGPKSLDAQLAAQFGLGGDRGQMGPPQQIGQVAEPNTQQLASQLQNVTQQVNQLSSHLGVSGGGMTQGPSQLNQLQGGIGGLLQNLRLGPPPPQMRTLGPPPMLRNHGR